MKRIFIGILSAFLLFGCDNDGQFKLTNNYLVIGQWDLTKIINNSVGGFTSPTENKTHYYQINEGGTFKRVAIENNIIDELDGTYTISDEHSLYGNDNTILKFIELSYFSSEARFFNCGFDEQKQILILTSENKLQNTLEGACDGDSYEYEKH